jgi:restriction endonuclease S subunit
MKRDFIVTLGKMLQSVQHNETETEEYYLRSANLRWEGVDITDIRRMWFAPKEKKKLALQYGDLLVSEGGDVGRTSFWQNELSNCYIQNAINRVRARKKDSTRFLYYWLHLIKSIGYIDAVVSRITIAHLTAEKLERIPFIKPPIPVQHRIASYLDKTCAAIDKTIGVKQKQLEILDALRKSIIHKAVTRGLDDSVDLKDSGVEWLGRIPKHWRIEKLKRLLSQPLMYGTNEAAELDDIEYPRYIRITDFGDNGTLKPESFKSLPPDKAEGYYLEEGDLLFARSGATVGKSFLFSNYKGLACFAGYLIRARTSKIKLLPKYLYYFTKSPAYFTWKNVIFTQATIQNISATKYAYLPVSVPSVDEQQLIIQHLDKKMKLLDNMQSNLSDQISTLERYRKSLIHECVTGKRRITEGDVQNQL